MTEPTEEELDRFVEKILKHKPKNDEEPEEKTINDSSLPEGEFRLSTSSIRSDGGILFIKGKDSENLAYQILISEVKNQGTNDLRAEEGQPKQAKGNAIERLGKNLIGLRTALLRENMFPYVCFG